MEINTDSHESSEWNQSPVAEVIARNILERHYRPTINGEEGHERLLHGHNDLTICTRGIGNEAILDVEEPDGQAHEILIGYYNPTVAPDTPFALFPELVKPEEQTTVLEVLEKARQDALQNFIDGNSIYSERNDFDTPIIRELHTRHNSKLREPDVLGESILDRLIFACYWNSVSGPVEIDGLTHAMICLPSRAENIQLHLLGAVEVGNDSRARTKKILILADRLISDEPFLFSPEAEGDSELDCDTDKTIAYEPRFGSQISEEDFEVVMELARSVVVTSLIVQVRDQGFSPFDLCLRTKSEL